MIIRDNFLLTLHKTMCCDPSSEPSQRDGSDEGITSYGFDDKLEKLPSDSPSYLELR